MSVGSERTHTGLPGRWAFPRGGGGDSGQELGVRRGPSLGFHALALSVFGCDCNFPEPQFSPL